MSNALLLIELKDVVQYRNVFIHHYVNVGYRDTQLLILQRSIIRSSFEILSLSSNNSKSIIAIGI